jgi:hypothetical protein
LQIATTELEAKLKHLWSLNEDTTAPHVITLARLAADALCVYVDEHAAEIDGYRRPHA